VVVDPDRAGDAAGTRFLFGPAGETVCHWPPTRAASPAHADPVALTDRPKPGVRGGVAYMPTLPRVRLVIVGAGHVGQAVGALAGQADFDVWVVDDRSQYANAERFPDAQRIIVGPFEEVLPRLDVTPHTYGLIVTRGHGHDQEALYHLVSTPAAFVGLIGSRRKIRLIFENLSEQGVSADALGRVSAPVGLDIGSQTVAEIAVSIVAELIARRNLGASARPNGLLAREPA
jgi:xanthine dehydrogenase accessory factor